jgi:hypothetical protein
MRIFEKGGAGKEKTIWDHKTEDTGAVRVYMN